MLDDPEFRRAGAGLALAAREFAEAVAADPRNPEALISAAIHSLSRDDLTSARTYTERGRDEAPGRSEVACLLAALDMVEVVPRTTVLDIPMPRSFRALGLSAFGGHVLAGGLRGGETHGFYLLSAADGTGVWTTDNAAAATLSPSGRYVAFAAYAPWDQPCEVKILDVLTGGSSPLASTVGPVFEIAWSPDETRLAISSPEGLMVIGSDGGGRSMLALPEGQGDGWSVAGHPTWLPGGNLLSSQAHLYEGIGGLEIFDLTTGQRKSLDIAVPRWGCGQVLWSPNGREFACTLDDEEPRGVIVSSLESADSDYRLVAYGPNVGGYAAAWSPDGSRLLFFMSLSHSPGTADVPILQLRPWLWDRSTGAVSLFSREEVSSVAWGDDGLIYYVTERDGRARLQGVKLTAP